VWSEQCNWQLGNGTAIDRDHCNGLEEDWNCAVEVWHNQTYDIKCDKTFNSKRDVTCRAEPNKTTD